MNTTPKGRWEKVALSGSRASPLMSLQKSWSSDLFGFVNWVDCRGLGRPSGSKVRFDPRVPPYYDP